MRVRDNLRRNGGSWHPGTVWYHLLPVVLVVCVACLFSQLGLSGDRDQKQPTPKGVYEIRQGGYVEKVDPNVDYKDRLPRFPPRTPAESLTRMHLIPELRLEQVAAEQLVRDPVELTFDENGRLFVAELTTYSERRAAKTGRVSMLEDIDGDGRFDKSTVFVDGLEFPTGLLWFDSGLFLCCSPDLLYCKDTNGDGHADVQEVILTGFDISNPNQCPNSLRWSLDDRIEGMAGGGGLLTAERWARNHAKEAGKPIQQRGRDFSFEPRSGELRLVSGGAQYGMAIDEWGRKFESSNSKPIEMIMYEDRYIARNPFLAAPSSRVKIWVDGNAVYRTSPVEPWRVIRTEMRIRKVFTGPVEGGGKPDGYFTSACGLTIYTGNAWPATFHGNAFVCEGASNLVHRMRLDSDGLATTAHRVESKKDFLTSDETWFRPIQFTNAPDGCLYLADMYREVYEHPDSIPPSVKKYLDINSGNDRGRIYRFVSPGFRQPPRVHLGDLSTRELVALLAHPNGWHRTTAARLLYERQDLAAVEPLTKLAAESSSALGRMHAMYALAGQDALTSDVVLPRLGDSHPRVREHAVRLSERVLSDAPDVREKLYRMVDDPDGRVRYQLAFTLGEIPGPRASAALAVIAHRDVADRWVRLAVLSSCFGRAGELFVQLANDRSWRQSSDARGLLAQLAEQAGRQERDDQIAEVFGTLETLAKTDKPLAQVVVRGLSKGLAKSQSPWRTRLTARGSRGSELLANIIGQAIKQAGDPDQPIDRRVQATRSLAIAAFDAAQPVLEQLLDSRQPQAVQLAALQTLSRFTASSVAPMIVAAWKGFTPKVRSEAAEALFARQERLATLLEALKNGQIIPSQLAPARVQFLLTHPEKRIRQKAAELLSDARLARREEIVVAYHAALTLPGDATRGKTLFKRHCSTCHRLEGVGFDLGLPLMTVKSRGPEGILMQVLDPNREVNPQYLDYMVLTQSGQVITGMITAETATSITLTRAEGQSDTVLRTDIEMMKSTGLSLMPEGLEKEITEQNLADLIAYLMSVE